MSNVKHEKVIKTKKKKNVHPLPLNLVLRTFSLAFEKRERTWERGCSPPPPQKKATEKTKEKQKQKRETVEESVVMENR